MTLKAKDIAMMGIAVSINIIGGFIALTLKFPIYLDSIGTIFISMLSGPLYGGIVGILTGLLNGILYDVYSLYFSPVGIALGIWSGFLYKWGMFEDKKFFCGIVFLTLPTSLISASISAFLFGGITSSGTTYIVQILRRLGLGTVVSAFIVQFFTDFVDRCVVVKLASEIKKKIK